jgi:hypothetical protein
MKVTLGKKLGLGFGVILRTRLERRIGFRHTTRISVLKTMPAK